MNEPEAQLNQVPIRPAETGRAKVRTCKTGDHDGEIPYLLIEPVAYFSFGMGTDVRLHPPDHGVTVCCAPRLLVDPLAKKRFPPPQVEAEHV